MPKDPPPPPPPLPLESPVGADAGGHAAETDWSAFGRIGRDLGDLIFHAAIYASAYYGSLPWVVAFSAIYLVTTLARKLS